MSESPVKDDGSAAMVDVGSSPSIKHETRGTDQERPSPSSERYEPSEWAHIFDETNMEGLEVEDEAMDEADTSNAPSFPAGGSPGASTSEVDAAYHPLLHETTPTASLLEPWNFFETTMSLSMGDFASSFSSTMTNPLVGMSPASGATVSPSISTASPVSRLLPPLHQLPPLADESASATIFGSAFGESYAAKNEFRQAMTGASYPTHFVPFERQSDNTPFPLSKPIMREDGVLLVGTEMPTPLAPSSAKNRIFVTNFRSFHPSKPAPFIQVQAEVRYLGWLTPYSAVAAIGRDIHTLQVGDASGDRCCRLQNAVKRVHSDTIREIAVNSVSPTTIASGGFDETVVVLDLGRAGGDSSAATLTTKFDGCDVVSSVRWIPQQATCMSWTTDGGDFQVADLRVRTAQLQIPLYSFLRLDQMGGLFCHEYMSSNNVALGFEHGEMLYVDLRMPRKSSCYGSMRSPLSVLGEMRRSRDGGFGLFGMGGFSTASVHESRRLDSMALVGFNQNDPSSGVYKTYGDFSYETGRMLAVSDNHGVVSVYNGNISSGGATTAGPWREQAV
ncbi:hypothetical protein Poli38472_005569 [Pythium oligandrum]|uniref:Uncharacterized protein n=1 Tax=Pythium oligandrum TaxID=41045 RepID=A0A8K1CHM2_PYTOL|nr:hypothetical protein Poli38472_005569 [Pythium oligandrum]|eukprot:TMW62951.1 hypothetical protein Poli38472_005569 [Pythium oligandrum]